MAASPVAPTLLTTIKTVPSTPHPQFIQLKVCVLLALIVTSGVTCAPARPAPAGTAALPSSFVGWAQQRDKAAAKESAGLLADMRAVDKRHMEFTKTSNDPNGTSPMARVIAEESSLIGVAQANVDAERVIITNALGTNLQDPAARNRTILDARAYATGSRNVDDARLRDSATAATRLTLSRRSTTLGKDYVAQLERIETARSRMLAATHTRRDTYDRYLLSAGLLSLAEWRQYDANLAVARRQASDARRAQDERAVNDFLKTAALTIGIVVAVSALLDSPQATARDTSAAQRELRDAKRLKRDECSLRGKPFIDGGPLAVGNCSIW